MLSLTGSAHAATGMANLYVQSGAAWERCTGNALTLDQTEALSRLIARHTLETLSAEDLRRQIDAARASLSVTCDLPLVRIDRDYFQNFVLPRLNPSEAQQAFAPQSRVAGD